MTASSITISSRKITRPPPAEFIRRPVNSWMNASGRRAMIPMRMMNEMPLPIPFWSMRSPSHMINMDPAANTIVMNTMVQNPISTCPPAALT